MWKKNRGSNIESLQSQPELRNAWSRIQAQLGIDESPGELWNIIPDGRHEFDHVVHAESFPKLSSESLRQVAETIFVGDKARHKHGFLHILDLDLKVSGEDGPALYDITQLQAR